MANLFLVSDCYIGRGAACEVCALDHVAARLFEELAA
jgi:hypothetical protein